MAQLRKDMAKLATETARGEVRLLLPVAAAAGCLGIDRSFNRAGNACQIRRNPDRCQLAVQRGRAVALGLAFGPDWQGSGFRILLGSQVIVFGILMTESNPWAFSALVCNVLLCFGGGFATMPSFVLEVFGARRMSVIYGAILTAWAAAGIFGPMFVGYTKDRYPDRAVTYCFLVGIVILGLGYAFSHLLNDDRIRFGRPTLQSTMRQFGIPVPVRK